MPSAWDLPLGPATAVPEDRSRFLRLHAVPETTAPGSRPHGTAVMIHGGYWKNKFGLDDAYGNAGTASLAPFFVQHGFSAVELEYRRRDHEGGGWPGTNEDIVAALQQLGELHAKASAGEASAVELAATIPGADSACLDALRGLRPDRIILVGHSAGGCLALWAAHRLPSGSGARVAAVLALAPVADLVRGHEMRVSDEGDAVELYMKCKPEGEEALEKYRQASPAAMLPVTFPLVVAYGDADKDVPPELVAGYAEAASSGAAAADLVREVRVPGADHFDVVNAASVAWRDHIAPALAGLLEPRLGAEAAAALRGRGPAE